MMKIGNQILKKEDSFIKENEKIIENIKELKDEKKTKNKSTNSMESDEIANNSLKNMSDNKPMTISGDNNSINLNENISISTKSSQLDDSDKEVKGDIFYDSNKRYIFKDYQKEIDGIFTEHSIIKLNKNKIDLNSGLKELLDNKYDIKNEIKSHIIYKNFDDPQINKNEPFIIEVKKSIAELAGLLNQIKNISKIVKNLKNAEFPKYIIGIICSYNNNQIIFQQQLLNSISQGESPLAHIMNIIENNNVNVVIGAIKDEQIFNYPLGKPDYDDRGCKTRIDIHYMNTFMAKLDNNKIDEIYNKYSKKYQSLTVTRSLKQNYDILNNNYADALKKNEILEQKLKKSETEKNQLQQKFETEKNIILNFIKERYGIEINPNEIKEKESK